MAASRRLGGGDGLVPPAGLQLAQLGLLGLQGGLGLGDVLGPPPGAQAVQPGLLLGQGGLGLGDVVRTPAGLQLAQLGLGADQIGLGLLQLQGRLVVLQLHQQVAGLDPGADVHQDVGHPAGALGLHGHLRAGLHGAADADGLLDRPQAHRLGRYADRRRRPGRPRERVDRCPGEQAHGHQRGHGAAAHLKPAGG